MNDKKCFIVKIYFSVVGNWSVNVAEAKASCSDVTS